MKKRFTNVFRTPSYRRAMDAVDDEFYAEQARKRREAEAAAQESVAPPQEQQLPQGETMNQNDGIPSAVGAPYEGGFYAGRIRIAGVEHVLIVAPKAEGEREDIAWLDSEARVAGADSYNDGMQNTVAMAEAGSELANWARGLTIGGHADWYIPSQDELELLYRNLKPTARKNYLYARSGVNVSAVPPTYPYTADDPAQTTVQGFAAGGEQAFADEWYWSSTQHAAYDDFAWGQDFGYGGQINGRKSSELRARAVRRFAI